MTRRGWASEKDVIPNQSVNDPIGRGPHGLRIAIKRDRTRGGREDSLQCIWDKTICLYPFRARMSAIRTFLFLSQLTMTGKHTVETINSPRETGDKSPLGLTNFFANSITPTGEMIDLAIPNSSPIDLPIFKYSLRIIRLRDDMSSPKTAYPENHFPIGT